MDPTPIVIGAVGLVIAGLAAYFVTKSASGGGIEVNSAIGIRTKLSQSSPQAWAAAHRAALPFTLVACLLAIAVSVISVTAVILANTAGVSPVVPVVATVGGYVGFLVVMFLGTRAGNEAVKSLP